MKKEKVPKQKSKLKNKGRMIGFISIASALVLAIILFAVTAVTVNDTVEIVRAKADISCGKLIEETDIEVIKVNSYNLSDNVIKDTASVVGKYATLEMKSGDYVLSSKVSKSSLGTDTQLSNIPDGQVAVSFSVKSLASGLSNKLQAGDIIRIYSYDANGVQEHQELSYVQVISTSDASGKEADDGTATYSTITVSATTEQAKALIPLETAGTIYVTFITRNATNAQVLLEKQAEMLR